MAARSPSRRAPFVALAALMLSAQPLLAQEDPTRLFGRVQLTDGSVYEGFIRWDGNESGSYDILHGYKPLPDRNRRDADRLGAEPEREENRIELFGIGFSWPSFDDVYPRSSVQSGVRLGHVSSLEVVGSNRARLLLRDGGEIELTGGGDIGRSVDGILVEDLRRGPVELEWDDIRVVDFSRPPVRPAPWGERLYGTLRTRGGHEFTGYLAWDMDELFGDDVLDGEDSDREVELPFSQIEAIERFGSGASRVRLQDGEELVLRGSNDVNQDNRDIMVADPALGEVRVEWDAFDRVVFTSPPASASARPHGPTGRLRGVVRARGGETQTGSIRWDNDEEHGWELLDGELESGVDLDIEMGAIASIERIEYDTSLVTLRDGRSFRLTGSNDVDEDNRGVYVEQEDGALVLLPWERFVRVDFDA